MSPLADTLGTLYERMPEAFWAWAVFGLAPVLVPALVSLSFKERPSSRLAFTLSGAARLVGGPALALVLIGPPGLCSRCFSCRC